MQAFIFLVIVVGGALLLWLHSREKKRAGSEQQLGPHLREAKKTTVAGHGRRSHGIDRG